MAIFIPFAPFIVWQTLTGNLVGEDFVESLPEGGALGLLMILYLALSIYHLRFVIDAVRRPNTQQFESPNSDSAIAAPK
jgi:hypothetical protein